MGGLPTIAGAKPLRLYSGHAHHAMAHISRLRPRFADRVSWNLTLPASQVAWLDAQKNDVLPSRASVLRDLIASAMKASQRRSVS